MQNIKIMAPCMFGVEGILAEELKRLGADNIKSENGRVFFSGDINTVAAANLGLRTAERVLIVLGEFNATTFDELFEGVKNIPFENFVSSKDAFPVTGYSISSQLHSIPDCQSIIKKAIVERLKQKYHISWFEETGSIHKIRFSILKNKVLIGLDTSGEGLHKRGYRAHSMVAPIKETLAAAMCLLARIYDDTKLYDPFCGSGTILIEAALIAKNMAPGLKRNFAAERFSTDFENAFKSERNRFLNEIKPKIDFCGFGSDIDEASVALTKENSKKAGVFDLIKANRCDIRDLNLPDGRMLLITNPPYGERLSDLKGAEELYKIMGKKMPKEQGKKYFIISPCEEFESIFGRIADKKRKLYNGMIKCQLYMYFKNN